MQLANSKKVATLLLRAIKGNLRVVADRNVVSVESISSGVSVNGVASQIWWWFFLLIWGLIVAWSGVKIACTRIDWFDVLARLIWHQYVVIFITLQAIWRRHCLSVEILSVVDFWSHGSGAFRFLCFLGAVLSMFTFYVGFFRVHYCLRTGFSLSSSSSMLYHVLCLCVLYWCVCRIRIARSVLYTPVFIRCWTRGPILEVAKEFCFEKLSAK